MPEITIRVLDGPDKGKSYKNVKVPVSIGREEGNSIQLNDERISRYHVRIQSEDGQLFLADLNSTNGTRLNGEYVQLAMLRPGDVVIMGRSIMLVGSKEEIQQRLADLHQSDSDSGASFGMKDEDFYDLTSIKKEFKVNWLAEFPNGDPGLDHLHVPALPPNLSPGQRAALSELFQYYILRFRRIIESAHSIKGTGLNAPDMKAVKSGGKNADKSGSKKNRMDAQQECVVPYEQWQNLLDLYQQTSEYINRAAVEDTNDME